MPLRARVTLVAFVIALLTLGNAVVASAEVTGNVRVQLGPFTMFGNPCDPSDGALTVTVIEHRLFKVESDGTTTLHINAHGTAVSANGTAYEIMRTSSIATAPGPGGLVTTDISIRRISHGEGDNAMITISGIGTTTMTVSCAG